jgi:THO complex subunit 4
VSNLDRDGITDQDINELFERIGSKSMKYANINYDRSGKSKGTAEVSYRSHADALEAIRQYHNRELDGNPMKVTIVKAPGGGGQKQRGAQQQQQQQRGGRPVPFQMPMGRGGLGQHVQRSGGRQQQQQRGGRGQQQQHQQQRQREPKGKQKRSNQSDKKLTPEELDAMMTNYADPAAASGAKKTKTKTK